MYTGQINAILVALGVLLAAPSAGALSPLAPPPSGPVVERCDALAAHPLDPDRTAPGVSREVIVAAGVEGAVAACTAALAVARSPSEQARLRYQLGRVLAYGDRHAESAPHLEAVAAAGHTQALFVRGFQLVNGLGAPRDPCRALPLLERSAVQGRTAGMIALAHHDLMGHFDGCQGRIASERLIGFVEQARTAEPGDYARGLLHDQLVFQLRQRAATP